MESIVLTGHNKSNRIEWIDEIRLIAAVLIVVLHVFENAATGMGGGYLIGTFGIPLFLVVNGYLLCDKNFTKKYLGRKIVALLRFIVLWVLCVGVLQVLVSQDARKIFECFIGTFLGNGRLFHLWFLWGLFILWSICYMVQRMLKTDKASSILRKWMFLAIAVLITSVFALNCVLYYQTGKEIRDIIPPALRLITNSGYFFTGMAIAKYKLEFDARSQINPIILIAMIAVAWIALISLANLTGMVYASSYYDFPLVWMACISIFMLVGRQKKENASNFRFLNLMRDSTTGIYILHPFMIALINKAFSLCGREANIAIKMLELVLIIVVCTIITTLMKKNRVTKVFVEI